MGSSGPLKGRAGVTGAAMRSLVTTPERRMRAAKKRQREEAEWASKSGPVISVPSGHEWRDCSSGELHLPHAWQRQHENTKPCWCSGKGPGSMGYGIAQSAQ